MKKVYILLMGLMTCMCLITTSCKNEEDDITSDPGNSAFSSFLESPGEYSGYWMVFNEKVDNCVLTCDGKTLTFSNLPVEILVNLIGAYDDLIAQDLSTANIGSYVGKKFFDLGNAQLEAYPFTIIPKQMGYTSNNLYFSANTNDSQNKIQGTIPGVYGLTYSFSIKSEEVTIQYFLEFSDEIYGVFNPDQQSRVIKFYIKECHILNHNGIYEHLPFNPMIELTFISKD